jgi:mono/diheme cytochrome c family protein
MPERARSIVPDATAVLAALLVAMTSAVADSPDSQAFGQIQNGRYLAVAADCTACHTVPDAGKPFAGGRAIETPFGNIVAPNITPDPDTGIGAWTDDEFDDAVRRGIRPNGARLYPAMPFTAYTKMSRADVLAIRAYLKTVAPVRNQVVANTLPFPFNIRAAMRVWDALYFTAGEFTPDPQKPADWNRGHTWCRGPVIAPPATRRSRSWAATRPANICAARIFRAGSPPTSPTMPGRALAIGPSPTSRPISRPATTA